MSPPPVEPAALSTIEADEPATMEPQTLWTPSTAQIEASRLHAYRVWLQSTRPLAFDDYESLWHWSVTDLDAFWNSIWVFFDVIGEGSREPALDPSSMPGASWFPRTKINYAENVFRCAVDTRPALIVRSEDRPTHEVSWRELADQVGAMAATLRGLGLSAGDRIVSYLPNRSETVVAFLACASIGAIWSSCSPDMGTGVVLDRFRQIEPKLIFATDSYTYNGKVHARDELIGELLAAMPCLLHVIHVRGPLSRDGSATRGQSSESSNSIRWRDCIDWADAVADPAPLRFERLPFGHPLWIVYSSGTTGLPKAIVHSQGGIVLTHLKTMALQHDLREGDRLLFLGGTGWIVWNLQLGALLTGASIVLYDGNPNGPDPRALWQFIDAHGVTLLGCGAAYLVACMKEDLRPKEFAALPHLRAINSTGSPLPIECYEWVYAHVKSDLWLASISGGTDIASGFVACAPILPVVAGEIQCRELGVAAFAFNERGESVVDEVGELVVTRPMPSMPVFFWADPDGRRYADSYFDMYPGVWRHGDWIRFTTRGSCVIYGRSDSTINRHGIRMGTAEIYRVVEALPEIRDSLVVDLEYLGQESFMPLFVALKPGFVLDEALQSRIADQIRKKASPRHVPNAIYEVEDVPRTLTGKKMEVPIRKLLLGKLLDSSSSMAGAAAKPESLAFFDRMAQAMKARRSVR